ncbi:MAG: hypothetical protein AAFQ57_17625 [Cyanobacteria bacterium J06626_14]
MFCPLRRSTIALGVFTTLFVFGAASLHDRAQAQNLNGIFSPRSSEQFFERGIERLEAEIELLQRPPVEPEELLDVDKSAEQQEQELMLNEEWLIDEGFIFETNPSIEN